MSWVEIVRARIVETRVVKAKQKISVVIGSIIQSMKMSIYYIYWLAWRLISIEFSQIYVSTSNSLLASALVNIDNNYLFFVLKTFLQ